VRHYTKNSISNYKYEVYGMAQNAVGMADYNETKNINNR